MAISYQTIEKDFCNLRDFILNDLGLILSHHVGGNYAAVLLITAACEAIGRLRYGAKNGGEHFFKEYLLPSEWSAVGNFLYDGLRNGLAHVYQTKTIIVAGNFTVELCISWKDQAHLLYNSKEGCLYINVAILAEQLCKAFDRYEKELLQDAKLRDTFQKWIKREKEVSIPTVKDQKTWRKILTINHHADIP